MFNLKSIISSQMLFQINDYGCKTTPGIVAKRTFPKLAITNDLLIVKLWVTHQDTVGCYSKI